MQAPKQWKKETQEQFFASERYKKWLASEPHEVEVKPKGNSMTQLYYRQHILPRYADELQEARRKRKNQIKLLIHPAQSPDLNPMEAIWNMLKQRLRKHPPPPTIDELKKLLRRIWWEEISQDEIRARIAEMPARCAMLCETGGQAIKTTLW
ncbi:MAG: hypothetical protein Q9179_007703 [Wetmoreana sp. 5 TL-2023]